MEKKRVLLIIESLSGGGAEKVLATLACNIDSQRFDVTVCTVVDTGVYSSKIRRECAYTSIIPAFPTHGSPLRRLLWKVRYKLVYNILPLSWVYRLWVPKGNDTEVAFVEGFTTKLLAAAPSHSRKIAWVHTDFSKNHWTSTVFSDEREEAKAYKRLDLVVGVSDKVRNSLMDLFGQDLKAITLYNPIDTEEIRRKAADLSVVLPPHRDGVIRLCTAGRLVHQKGYDRLLPIVKRLIDSGYDVELWILGTGPDYHALHAYIEDHNLADRVTLWGFQPNPYRYIAASDLFVVSSRAEGYSTAVTEALILGLPVVTTDCSGMKDLLGDDNRYGIVTDNDDDALYRGILSLLDDEEALVRYKSAARHRGDDFRLGNLVNSIQDIL